MTPTMPPRRGFGAGGHAGYKDSAPTERTDARAMLRHHRLAYFNGRGAGVREKRSLVIRLTFANLQQLMPGGSSL